MARPSTRGLPVIGVIRVPGGDFADLSEADWDPTREAAGRIPHLQSIPKRRQEARTGRRYLSTNQKSSREAARSSNAGVQPSRGQKRRRKKPKVRLLHARCADRLESGGQRRGCAGQSRDFACDEGPRESLTSSFFPPPACRLNRTDFFVATASAAILIALTDKTLAVGHSPQLLLPSCLHWLRPRTHKDSSSAVACSSDAVRTPWMPCAWHADLLTGSSATDRLLGQ